MPTFGLPASFGPGGCGITDRESDAEAPVVTSEDCVMGSGLVLPQSSFGDICNPEFCEPFTLDGAAPGCCGYAGGPCCITDADQGVDAASCDCADGSRQFPFWNFAACGAAGQYCCEGDVCNVPSAPGARVECVPNEIFPGVGRCREVPEGCTVEGEEIVCT